MRVPVAWLREYCDPGVPAEEIADALTMSGLKVERLHRVGVGDVSNFRIGHVLSADPHPDADRLTVCTVDIGASGPSTIVCGAPNVAAGQMVAVAVPGAVMPDGTELGKAKLRGIESHGMILAEDEVGIGEDHQGIMVLDGDLPVGAPLSDHLRIIDEVLELEITPNRPDAMCVYGVARDVHAVTEAGLAEDPSAQDAEAVGEDSAEDHATVEIADPEICLRFTARVFEDVKIGPSPLWLKQRLMAAGQRPISNVVDITNYVMLTTAQPLHAFDLDEVRGRRIVVRRAREGETMTTLDGVERTFSDEMALVCDAEGPSGIAGVMGGLISEVSDSTTRVLMEAATWVGPNIMRTSKALALRSEASARFEKQLHPDQALAAQRLAARLMVELCGARMVPGTIDAYPSPAEPREVAAAAHADGEAPGRADRGGDRERESWSGSGSRMSGGASGEAAALRPRVLVARSALARQRRPARGRPDRGGRPHPRARQAAHDSARARAGGRPPDRQPAAAAPARGPAARPRPARDDLVQLHVARSAAAAAPHGRGAAPDREPAQRGAERHAAAAPARPAWTRRATTPRTGARAWRCSSRRTRTCRPARSSRSPRARPAAQTPADEHHRLAALLTETRPHGWRTPAGTADFYAAKALLEAVLEAAGIEGWRVDEGGRPFLHPGRAASVVTAEGVELGWIGELHPLVLREWELQGTVAAFELEVDLIHELTRGRVATYSDVTSFPAVLQDIAVIVPEDVPAAQLAEVVRAGAGELLASMRVFDLYHGEQVGEGSKSLALRLEFRAPDRTLTDEEVAERRAAIEAELESIGGRLRA